jgi:hypothetical protein
MEGHNICTQYETEKDELYFSQFKTIEHIGNLYWEYDKEEIIDWLKKNLLANCSKRDEDSINLGGRSAIITEDGTAYFKGTFIKENPPKRD